MDVNNSPDHENLLDNNSSRSDDGKHKIGHPINLSEPKGNDKNDSIAVSIPAKESFRKTKWR